MADGLRVSSLGPWGQARTQAAGSRQQQQLSLPPPAETQQDRERRERRERHRQAPGADAQQQALQSVTESSIEHSGASQHHSPLLDLLMRLHCGGLHDPVFLSQLEVFERGPTLRTMDLNLGEWFSRSVLHT